MLFRSMKLKTLLLTLLLSIVFSTTSFAKEVLETWECTELRETKVLVKARIFKDRVFGEINVADITHPAIYGVNGFNRRWDFDPRDDGRFKYALIIKPNGDGLYYEFPEERAEVSASMVLECSN